VVFTTEMHWQSGVGVMMCGPPPLMRDIRRAMDDLCEWKCLCPGSISLYEESFEL
jgi:NAD(P)H-flavin reductase